MAKQPSAEPKAPLIVALAFFVLASLVLGVLFYLENDKKNSAVEEAKKAKDAESAAKKQLTDAQDQTRMYRVAIGVGTADELAALSSSSGTKAKEEFDKLQADLAGKMKGLTDKRASMLVGQNVALAPKTTDLLDWPAMAAGKPDKEPVLSLADAVVKATASQLLAAGKQATAEAALAAATKSYQDQEAMAKATRANLDQTIESVKKELKDAQDKLAAQEAATRKLFETKTNEYTKKTTDMQEEATRLGILQEELRGKVTGLEKQNERLTDRQEAAEDPFRMQKPLGRVIRRERGSNTVYINLGSADRVTVGLRFTVQPANTPEVGVSGRLRPRMLPNGRPLIGADGQPVYDMVPKGRLEVVSVEGESLSRCRITSETDPYRERIEVGDLLYNTSWRRGQTDTVALYGVFDANGDGTDDMRVVIRDLQRMGITVAAYFDLDQRKWLDPTTGRPTVLTEQVVYAIEGAYPASAAGDNLATARGELAEDLNKARQAAKDRGIKVVKARTYFPQIGYEYRGADVSADRINQAYNRYLRTASPGDAPPPAPMPEGK
jgi:hypothetical protein